MVGFGKTTFKLFKQFKSTHPTKRIQFITDSEGDLKSFLNSINNGNTVKYHQDSGLSFKSQKNSKEHPYFIFGGDVTDRGSNDIELTELLVDFKKRNPEQVILLVGNRDITKNRFKIELNPEVIRERLLYGESPRWLSLNPTLPLDYVKSAMIAQNYNGDINNPFDTYRFVTSQSIEQCQIIYLHWMLEKTMGCPHSFRYRRNELAKKSLTSSISDAQVLKSFIDQSLPTGPSGQYLKLAQVGVVFPEGILAVHGGLQPTNIGRIPSMAAEDKIIDNMSQWINQFNSWYKQQITYWEELNSNTLTMPAFTDLDECVLPIPGKIKSIITSDMLNASREFIEPSKKVLDYLATNKTRIVLNGHQPGGDHPVCLRQKNVLFINGDTGYSSFNPQNLDDSRGAAFHSLEIVVSGQEALVSINATLSNKIQVTTQFSVTPEQIKGNPYIGRVTEDNQLIQCKLPDDQYRLIRQKGFKVDYIIKSEDEIKKRFAQQIEDEVISKNGRVCDISLAWSP